MDGSYLRGNYLVLHKASADVETPITPIIVAPRLMSPISKKKLKRLERAHDLC